ncbi:MAG: nuclear transport factor 2 family protein [Pseudomonadota bacterium]
MLVLAPLALGGCDRVVPSAETFVAKPEVQALTITGAIVAAVNRGDAAQVSASNAPDYELYSHGYPNVVGPEDALASNTALLKDEAITFAIDNVRTEVSQDGDMVVLTADYDWTYTDSVSGEVVAEQGNWVLIFKRQSDGQLKVWREIASDTAPAQSPAAAGS